MTSRQESKRSSYLVVEEFITKESPSILAQMPDFLTVFDSFQNGIKAIGTLSENQIYNRTGYKDEKEEVRTKMTTSCLIISSRITAFAVNINDSILYNKVYRSKSSIEGLNDTLVMDFCRLIRDEGTARLADLGTYGITATMLGEFNNEINLYATFIPLPRVNIVNRKESTKDLAIQFGLCDADLFRMDTLVRMLQYTEVNFYSQYMSARMIIETGSRKMSLRGTVKGMGAMPLDGVTVSIPDLKISKLTTAKGNYEVQSIPQGIYAITFEKPGYLKFTGTIAITANERTELNVDLVAMSSELRKAS